MCLSEETRKAIRIVMEQHGVTQAQLAEKLGTSAQYVSNVLNGRDAISMKTADRIVAALGCRIRVKLEKKK